MSANATQPWPPDLSPTQSEAIPTWRAAYSDRTSALMALFCELAHHMFVADQAPADQEAGRKELERRLQAGSFRLIRVFKSSVPRSPGRTFCGSCVSRQRGKGVVGH
jgi:hypothetical protein